MFNGIVEALGRLQEIEGLKKGLRFYIKAPFYFREDVEIGHSISVNGACLTVVGWDEDIFWVDLSPETLGKTYFRNCAVGDFFNLERALKLSSRIHGHWVSGHVDGVGKVLEIGELGDFSKMSFGFSSDVCRELVYKGAVSIDGVSLTINATHVDSFEVMIIPETLKKTTLGMKKVGDPVQMELDLLGKYIQKWAQR